ncbi:MAG: Rieske 2Fe-2S domain-containing protein [Actinomycetota bacterium]|nr:Rieske 2Fe-2S domain-containing protein [Actinomycetota bacterium]
MADERFEEWRGGEPGSPVMHELAERIGKVEALDAPAEKVADQVSRRLGRGRFGDLLSGTWLGHALHPFFTDLPIGTWTSATLLDLFGGPESDTASERLVAFGLATAVPTAVTGLTDWADTTKSDPQVRRIGFVHGLANTAGLALFAASLAARRRGSRSGGKLLGLAGMGALTVGGHLGGHLSYSKGVGVDQTTFEKRPKEWTAVLADAALADGETKTAELEGVTVLVTRQNGRVFAMSNRCSHRGGPLHRGEIANGCVTCPWHGSVFRLEDGSVERGPSAYPQPVFDVRIREGTIEVRASQR